MRVIAIIVIFLLILNAVMLYACCVVAGRYDDN